MSDQTQAIRIRALTKTFRTGLRRRRTRALEGLDLEVAPGEILGFLGPNGAGKTTTIKILVGLLRPDNGQAWVFGHPAGSVQARRGLAYLPELPDFYDYLSPVEFLSHAGRLAGMETAAIRRRVAELLERVGLDPNERRHLKKFSKGMLQRVGIAQAMLADPDLYILDEPMGGLDPLGRRWMKDLILELGRAGKTVFFSSHVLAEAEAVCDRVAFLHRGRLVAQGELRQVLQAQAGSWEILVEGEAVRTDKAIQAQAASLQPAGADTMLVPAADAGPEGLVRALMDSGHRILSVGQRHASLEEVFIRAMDADQKED